MAKLGWKLSQGPDNLAQKCINSKYIHRDYVTSFAKGSPIWQSVGKGRDLLTKNSHWILGNGLDIDFWNDNWLGIGTIRSHVASPLNLHEAEYKVRDITRDGGVWKLELLTLTLPDHIASQILLNLDPSNQGAQNDIRAPIYLEPQGFSLALPYKNQILSNNMEDLGGIWKVNTSPKVQFFLWLVCLDHLPHNKMLRDRHITQEARCPRCSYDVEDTNHILRQCPNSQNIWTLVSTHTSVLNPNMTLWAWEH